MAKIAKISEIHPTLGFTEFDILEKYRKSFHESGLGRSAKIALMVLKAYTGFSDRQLVEHLNGTCTTRFSVESS